MGKPTAKAHGETLRGGVRGSVVMPVYSKPPAPTPTIPFDTSHKSFTENLSHASLTRMDKEYCLKAIAYYDKTIAHLSSDEVRTKYKREGWIRCNDNHIRVLKLERDFFIRELQAMNAYEVKVTRKEKH